MAKYTIHIQYSFSDSLKWGGSVYGESEEIKDDRDPQEILESRDWTDTAVFVLGFPSGAIWRVAIWEGHGVDVRTTEPTAVLGPWKAAVDGEGAYPIPEQTLLTELETLTEKRVRDDRQRESLVHGLMRTAIPRGRIAAAAGVKEARLYQIRDRRR